MKFRPQRAILGLWLGLLLACGLIIAKTRFVSDMSAFMPKAPSARQRLLVDQFQYGIIGRLIMIGIEGGDAAGRARLSQELASRLRRTRMFMGVQNGDSATEKRDRAYFFDNRYLLSPDITPARFTVPGLHSAIKNSIDALSGDAGLIVKQLFARDPTGETLRLLDQFGGSSQPRSLHGAWASRDGKRAVLLAYTRAPGTDIEAQARAIDAIRNTFKQLPDRQANSRVVMSGTSVFAVNSRNTIQGQVTRLATASLLLVVFLLLLVYRSPSLLAFGLLPVLSGALVGIASVSLSFGQVHDLTLGFGTTLIGEAVDYSIYFSLQRAGQLNPGHFWRTIWLGVATSIAGFAPLLFSGFPGLAQLGVYSISGLIAAALVTRYVLPALVPRQLNLRDLSRPGFALDRLLDFAARLRWLPLLLALAAVAIVFAHAGRIWNRNLSALSPISKADQRLDQKLRRDLGAPDLRFMVAFSAPNEELALEGAEKAGQVLHGLVHRQVIAGFSSPAFVLPSHALQRARQAAIPDLQEARRRLRLALVGLPVRIARLQGFLSDLQAAKEREPLRRADLDGTSAALLVDSLLIHRASDYLVLMPLRPLDKSAKVPLDINRVQTALRAGRLKHIFVIDLLAESTNLFRNYRNEVLLLSEVGCLVIIALLLAALKSATRTLRVITPLVCSVTCVTGLLLQSGTRLTIMHLVGLLLVVAIGSNYALFFESGGQTATAAERRRMQVSLVVANLTTVGSFGILGLSSIPVLSAVGATVSIGALLTLLFAAILSRGKTGLQPL
ncbi:MAG: MMPL family transporter [Acidiferrobacterales bacterium]